MVRVGMEVHDGRGVGTGVLSSGVLGSAVNDALTRGVLMRVRVRGRRKGRRGGVFVSLAGLLLLHCTRPCGLRAALLLPAFAMRTRVRI